MRAVEFKKLNWPKGLNLHLLAEVLPERELREFLVKHSKKERTARRIILPSQRAIKKVYLHYVWSLVERGEVTWSKTKRDFKRQFQTLKALNVTKLGVKKAFLQREKEIARESNK